MEINRIQFNRDFIVVYCPHDPFMGPRKGRSIVTINKMEKIIGNDKVFEAKVNQILNMEGDKTVVKLRRGIEFKVWAR